MNTALFKYINKLLFAIIICMMCSSFISCSRTTIYIVRHAEKDTVQKNNPPLTVAGLQRAQELAVLMKSKNISKIYSTNLLRTISTVQPTADKLGLKVELYDSIPQLINMLSFQNKKNILVAGHSNTILEIANALGTVPVRQEIGDHDFDNLLIVNKAHFLFWKKTELEETTYGIPTLPQ